MKNRNIQFKPAAGVLIPLLLVCFAAVFICAALRQQPATWCRLRLPSPAVRLQSPVFPARSSGAISSEGAMPRTLAISQLSSITASIPEIQPSHSRKASSRSLGRTAIRSSERIMAIWFPLMGQYSQSSENSRSREGQVDSLARPEEALHRARLMSRQASPR